MRLDAGDIYLAPPDRARVDELLAVIRSSVETVGRWLPWCTPQYGMAEALEWIERSGRGFEENTAFEFSIYDAATDEILGSCGLNQIDPVFGRANLGYWVRRGRQGHGIAPAAARRVARFGFEEKNLNRIEIVAQVENVASQRVAEKIGATREGVLRNRLMANGIAFDAVMFSLIPGEV